MLVLLAVMAGHIEMTLVPLIVVKAGPVGGDAYSVTLQIWEILLFLQLLLAFCHLQYVLMRHLPSRGVVTLKSQV
jgi:hypothetical protein